ncbi:hypothetical protein LTR62_001705 [Meristemomyces frigidus]|uniref:Uncharacterized protein n=1 Tax=Meristemomyces frigidus TaxID=1508187 RepID=A0AAN7T857_9PEZI|nr:hypothetical protein LTR62_001705 [Meristemomyces frigidus]
MTSKTRLLRNSFLSSTGSFHSLRAHSTESTRQPDGFETWVTTSAALGAMEEGISLARPLTHKDSKSRLETIPGSRPASPAKILNGPFTIPAAAHETSSPDSRAHSPSTVDETSSIPHNPSTKYIHPLFRPESPFAPPLPSPGTNITASPLAGQIVSPEHAFNWTVQSAQTWRPSSPLNSPAVSRRGSVGSLVLQSSTGPVGGTALPRSPLSGDGEAFPG